MSHGFSQKSNKSSGWIVITGCDSGIGKSLAEKLISRDFNLIISYLKTNHFENCKNVHSIKMDLTETTEVNNFTNFIDELCKCGDRVEALIINSGVALGGPIEDIPMNIYRESFEINYFGAVNIIKRLIPHVIKTKGKIAVIGSMAGKIAMPFLSPYASTKFALEGFCDSLRRELNPFGIKTILFEPAAVATPIWNKAKEQEISYVEEKYLKSLYSFRDNFIEGGNKGMDVSLASEEIADILFKKNPKSRYIIAKNPFTSKILTLVPTSLIDKAVIKMFKMDYGK